jgi:hypothetical protein
MNDTEARAENSRPRPKDPHEAQAEAARRDLERLAEQGEIIGTSSMARSAKASLERAGRHLGGADAPQDDPIEVWGTRIGRALGVVFFIGLLIYMAVTYL